VPRTTPCGSSFTAERLAVEAGSDYVRLADRYGTSATAATRSPRPRYSVTFGALRRARRHWRQRPPGLDPDADVRQLPDDLDPDGDDTVIELREWRFVGTCRMPS
jgi:hypothetical protein